jgi:hypothetical protein
MNRLLELAIVGLEAQRTRIEEELTQLRRSYGEATSKLRISVSTRKRGRKRTAAEKKAHSERMKAIWAAKKKKNK